MNFANLVGLLIVLLLLALMFLCPSEKIWRLLVHGEFSKNKREKEISREARRLVELYGRPPVNIDSVFCRLMNQKCGSCESEVGCEQYIKLITILSRPESIADADCSGKLVQRVLICKSAREVKELSLQ